ncbi:MAG: hypothetical protein ACMG5Z_06840 [Luteimonas sp.]
MKGCFKALLVCIALAAAPVYANSNKLMRPAARQQQPALESGKAMLVIMRPSFVGGAIAASVYDISGDQTRLIGVLGPKDKTFLERRHPVDCMRVCSLQATSGARP